MLQLRLTPALASIISTILVIAGHQSIGAGIALAIPLAAAGRGTDHHRWYFLWSSSTLRIRLLMTATWTATGSHVSSLFLQAMRVAIPAVIVALYDRTSKQNMLNAIPEVVTNSLNIAGGGR
ncbi:PTS sugar transporter subunit IIC [Escherichia coli]